ncbi:MAG TPA: RNA-guided endonuclease TnpB family protein [Streptosporangiaceae bacterium]|nr:RNA-guided endonuclease TnpB family protein [Streptosporangiaceae bacterium]
MTLRAYRFALDPTPARERAPRSHAAAARVAFNRGLARVKANLAQRAAEATYGLAGLVDTHRARILSATVQPHRGRWFASLSVAAGMDRPSPAQPGSVAGLDLGIKTLAVLPAGQRVPNPRQLDRALRKVRRSSRPVSRRQGPGRRTGPKPSGRWRRADAARNRVTGKVTDARADAQHKLTTGLAATYGTIVADDPNVAGMVRNKRLARRVGDASFGQIRRQLTHKTEWNGGTVIVADRWYASSKTCPGCRAVKTKLLVSERAYACVACGLVTGRDANAALNLAEYGRRHLAASGADRSTDVEPTVSPGPARRVAAKRQPGTRARGETGAVPTQDGTAA